MTSDLNTNRTTIRRTMLRRIASEEIISATRNVPFPETKVRGNRKVSFGKKLLTLVVGLAIGCPICECLVLLVLGEQPKFPRRVVEAPWGLRYNEPGASYRHKSADIDVHFSINAQGMRSDSNVAYARTPDVKRIVCLGDSFTIGYEVEQAATFSSVLQRQLNAAGQNVQVLNAGVSGFSTAEEVLYLERELFKYEPSVVVISFFGNDLVDNVRANLFTIGENGLLVPQSTRYIPGGRFGNFLNSNCMFNVLSEYSNAFVLTKEAATNLLKSSMVAANQANVDAASQKEKNSVAVTTENGFEHYQKRLAGRIFERLYDVCYERGIPLVIQSIPCGGVYGSSSIPDQPLVELFPLDEVNVDRPGMAFLPMIEILKSHWGQEQLIWEHSHFHWTPFCHRKSGEALAQIILDSKFLE